jgi:hypothetical protein
VLNLRLPRFALTHEQTHEERDQHGREAAQEDVAPGRLRLVGEPDAGNLIVHRARKDDAERRGRVDDRGRLDAPLRRHGFCYESCTDGPFAADAEARNHAKKHELP